MSYGKKLMDTYQSPFTERYASDEMLAIFSPQNRYAYWRKLWVVLAEEQRSLGLPITEEQICELTEHVNTIDFAAAADYEKRIHHDVMAHIHAYADQCPKAGPIIHLGATSCYVTDNTDLLIMREGLNLILCKLKKVIQQLASFATEYASLACLGYTHFQPAQLTTVGKRTCLWIQEFLMDLDEIRQRSERLRFLGAKGTTGTQASFLALFNGDHEKVKELDKRIAQKMGFTHLYTISGQTYTRKQDSLVMQALTGLAASAHKCGTDIRLLAHLKEIEEPFAEKQVGSSAMPYKRNPMLCERICGLGRFVISLGDNGAYTAATQWLERTLDDSSNRRLSIPEMFLACDAILELMLKVASGLIVYPAVIAQHVNDELPFMATENILMACVKKGGDRQELHERIRKHSQAAAEQVKQNGKRNDLLERIEKDKAFALTYQELQNILNLTDFIGRSPQQVEEFIREEVTRRLA